MRADHVVRRLDRTQADKRCSVVLGGTDVRVIRRELPSTFQTGLRQTVRASDATTTPFAFFFAWLHSRVVSVLDSGAEGPLVQIAAATLSGNSLRQTVHTHRASVHQAAKLVAALLRVARVTAGLAESNGSLPPGL